jgi:chromosome segregation ATPase
MPQGDDAYRQDLYGPEIIVERVIRANGSTSYKLMNGTTKKKVADKARELTAIVDQFDIQVDNPIAILSQEESKRFLKSKDPKDM